MQWNGKYLPGSGQSHRTRSETIQLKLSKLLPASAEEVFDMWLDADSLGRWMCAADTEVANIELNPVVGGTFRFDMRAKDGTIFSHTGQYLEIQRPTRLIFTWNSLAVGNHSSQVTVEFNVQADGCLLVLVHDLPSESEIVENHRKGWTVILARLAEVQRSKRE